MQEALSPHDFPETAVYLAPDTAARTRPFLSVMVALEVSGQSSRIVGKAIKAAGVALWVVDRRTGTVLVKEPLYGGSTEQLGRIVPYASDRVFPGAELDEAHSPRPNLPAAMANAPFTEVNGRVIVEVDGTVRPGSFQLLRSSDGHPAPDAHAVAQVTKILPDLRFTPARYHGRPVAAWGSFQFLYGL
jgi:hypothetical protein